MKRLLVLLTALAVTLVTPMTVTSYNVEIDESRLATIIQMILEANATPATKQADRAADRMWDKLCNKLREGIDCSTWERPTVMLFKPNPLRPGLMGYYDGTNIIYIRKNLYAGPREEVLAHEMSHYVDQLLGLLPPMPVYSDDAEGIIKLCQSEKIAWGVSDAYNLKEVWGNRSRFVGETWVDWYEHCTPYRDVLYPKG